MFGEQTETLRERRANGILWLLVVLGFLVCCSALLRSVLGWYGERRLGILRIRLRDKLTSAGAILFENSS